MERLERVILLADTDELDGLTCDLTDRQRSPTASVAVHLCQHDSGQRKLFVKFIGRADGVLSGHGVGHEQDLLRVHEPLKGLHLLHELIVYMQATGGVDDEHIRSSIDGFAAGLFWPAFYGGSGGVPHFSFVKIWLDFLW